MIFVINESRGIRCPLTVKLEKFPEGCMTLDGDELGMKLKRECCVEKQQSFFLKRCCYGNCVFAGSFSSPRMSGYSPQKAFSGKKLFPWPCVLFVFPSFGILSTFPICAYILESTFIFKSGIVLG